MRHSNFLLILLLALTVLFSCSEPTLIGSELLDEDRVNLEFSDQIPVTGKTVQGDALQTYSPFTTAKINNSLLGHFKDDDFGNAEASIYTQFALGSQVTPDVARATLDSIILTIVLDTTLAGYGDLTKAFNIEVFPIQEDMQNVESYFSDQTFMTGAIIGGASITPTLDSAAIESYVTDSLTIDTIPPHIRIPLSNSFFLPTLDTAIYASNEALLEMFKGIHIKVANDENEKMGILNLDFAHPSSKISLFYSTTVRLETTHHEYQFDFNNGNSRMVNLSSTFTGSSVNNYIDTELDSLLFVQGMHGVNTEISFPDLSNLQDIIVNRAELEFTVDISTNTTYLPTQLTAASLEEDELNIITDLQSVILQQGTNNALGNFGGQPIIEMENGVSVLKYKLNISDHFQKILKEEVENSIIISAGIEQSVFRSFGQPFRVYDLLPAKASNASRAIFYGPNHSQYPVKLNLTFTKL